MCNRACRPGHKKRPLNLLIAPAALRLRIALRVNRLDQTAATAADTSSGRSTGTLGTLSYRPAPDMPACMRTYNSISIRISNSTPHLLALPPQQQQDTVLNHARHTWPATCGNGTQTQQALQKERCRSGYTAKRQHANKSAGTVNGYRCIKPSSPARSSTFAEERAISSEPGVKDCWMLLSTASGRVSLESSACSVGGPCRSMSAQAVRRPRQHAHTHTQDDQWRSF